MKRYDEIAKRIFERRNKYIEKRKKKKKIIISTVSTCLCCCIVLTIGLVIFKGGIVSNNVPQQNSSGHSDNNSFGNSSQETDASSAESEIQNDELPTQNDYFIDSIDKINFYSAKKIVDEKSLLPVSIKTKNSPSANVVFLSNNVVTYPFDRNKVFTVTMVTYFTVELKDENGFLAQKLGGTGLVEVVVTQNDLDVMGYMITFKKGDKYYSCLMNGASYDPASHKTEREFSTHKYIDGFNLVKNKEQENYTFIVHYEGSKVVGFECDIFNEVPLKNNVDEITFVDDRCVVIFTKQYFTVDQLEAYIKNENMGDLL